MTGKGSKIVIQNIFMPNQDESGQVLSRHIMICVSGFLSESGNYKKDWESLVSECRARNMPLYTINWEAKQMDQIEDIAINQAKQNLAPIITGSKNWGSIFSKENLSNLGSFLVNTTDQTHSEFIQARGNAKTTGKLLAHFLASPNSPLFGDHTFSLMGFSLGS